MTTQNTSGSSAAAVGQETKQAAAGVASTATDEARKVARETSDQVRQLWGQTRSDLTEQAGTQQERAAAGLRELSDQLSQMAGAAEQDGPARGLVDDVARRAGEAAGWLEDRDPGALLDEARRFAQRRPGTFLAVAAGLGVLAGRMSRGLVAEHQDGGGSTGSTGSGSAESGPTPGSIAPGSGSPARPAVGGTMPTATDPAHRTTATTPLSPGSSPQAVAAGATVPGEGLPGVHRQTQPLEPDGTPAPIGDDGHLTGPGQDDRGGR